MIYMYMKRKAQGEDQDLILLTQSQTTEIKKINDAYDSSAKKAANIVPKSTVIEKADDAKPVSIDIGVDPEFLEEQKKCAFKQ